MADTTTARLDLPLLRPAQAQKHVTHNEALLALDAVTQLVLETHGLNSPPAGPDEGSVHLVGPEAAEAWTGQEGRLAVRRGQGWAFLPVFAGLRAWSAADSVLLVHDGTEFVPLQIPVPEGVEAFGIGGAAAGPANPLSVGRAGDAADAWRC